MVGFGSNNTDVAAFFGEVGDIDVRRYASLCTGSLDVDDIHLREGAGKPPVPGGFGEEVVRVAAPGEGGGERRVPTSITAAIDAAQASLVEATGVTLASFSQSGGGGASSSGILGGVGGLGGYACLRATSQQQGRATLAELSVNPPLLHGECMFACVCVCACMNAVTLSLSLSLSLSCTCTCAYYQYSANECCIQ